MYTEMPLNKNEVPQMPVPNGNDGNGYGGALSARNSSDSGQKYYRSFDVVTNKPKFFGY